MWDMLLTLKPLHVFFLMVLIVLILLLIYFWLIRPWHLHWGATANEVQLELPGDDVVEHPHFDATRAITIHSTPKLIWRWLIQMGTGRAGFYSVDWIDNKGQKSADQIVPEFQHIEHGQFIPFTPGKHSGMWVKDFKEHAYILWTDNTGDATWLWYLVPMSTGKTRLLTRLRTKYVWRGFWILYYLLYDIGDIMLMRRCMKGIKQRAGKEYYALTHGPVDPS